MNFFLRTRELAASGTLLFFAGRSPTLPKIKKYKVRFYVLFFYVGVRLLLMMQNATL